MSEVVDKWVDKLSDIRDVGGMTHRERMRKAMERDEPDMVPCAPSLDLWQILYAGYDFFQAWDSVDICTDAALKTWADFRTDVIWPYFCPSCVVDPLLRPEQRETWYDLRDGRSYVVFKEITENLDTAIEIFETRPWEKYGIGRLQDYLDHFGQLLEFSKRTGRKVPIMLGLSNVSNICDWMGVQNMLKWISTEPKEKVHRLLELVAEYAYAGIEACRPYAEDGVEFVCIFGGSRTWGPKQVAEFGIYDRVYAEKVAELFKYPMHHLCGNNLPYTFDALLHFPNAAMQFDQSMMQLNWSWAQWCEWAARMASGKQCLANSPTTQAAVHARTEVISAMVKEFIGHTTPYTTAIVMPGCQLSTATPTENVKAIVETARQYGVYPACKEMESPIWDDAEFQESVRKLVGKYESLTSSRAQYQTRLKRIAQNK